MSGRGEVVSVTGVLELLAVLTAPEPAAAVAGQSQGSTSSIKSGVVVHLRVQHQAQLLTQPL